MTERYGGLAISEAAANSIVVVSAGISLVVVVLALRSAGKERPIRKGLEYARMIAGAVSLLTIGAINGVQTPLSLALPALAAGLALGYLQGRGTTVRLVGETFVFTRTVWGAVAFTLGIVSMQLAGLGSRVEVFRIGQTVGVLSVATMLGLVLGRAPSERSARGRNAAVSLAAVVLMTSGSGLIGSTLFDTSPVAAQTNTVPALCDELLPVFDRDTATGAIDPSAEGSLVAVCNAELHTPFRPENIFGEGEDLPQVGFSIRKFISTTVAQTEWCSATGGAVPSAGFADSSIQSDRDTAFIAREFIVQITDGGEALDREVALVEARALASRIGAGVPLECGGVDDDPISDSEESGDGTAANELLGGGTITSDEAAAAAIGGVIAALAVGILTLSEAREEIDIIMSGTRGMPPEPPPADASGKPEAVGTEEQIPPETETQPWWENEPKSPLAEQSAHEAVPVVDTWWEPAEAGNEESRSASQTAEPCSNLRGGVAEWRPKVLQAAARHQAASDAYNLSTELLLDDWWETDAKLVMDFAFISASIWNSQIGNWAAKGGLADYAKSPALSLFAKGSAKERFNREAARAVTKGVAKGAAKASDPWWNVVTDGASDGFGKIPTLNDLALWTPSGFQKATIVEVLGSLIADAQARSIRGIGLSKTATELLRPGMEETARSFVSNVLKLKSLSDTFTKLARAKEARDRLSEATTLARAELDAAGWDLTEATNNLRGYRSDLQDCLNMYGDG